MRGLVASLAALLLAAPASAPAEEGAGEGARYLQHLVEGHRLYGENQHEAALRAYRSALEVMEDDALATYFVGCAQRAMGDLEEAVASFERAAELAGEGDAALQARALWNVAATQEARRELAAARRAWRAYIAFAESHQRVTTYVANARQRLGAITSVEELDAAYGPVRERIAARAAESSD